MSVSHQTTHYDFVSRRKLWYLISFVIMLPCLVFFLMGGLKMGIDFTGGSLFELAFEKTPAVSEVRNTLQTLDKEKFSDAQISQMVDDTGAEIITVRSKAIDDLEQITIFEGLKTAHGDFQQVRVEVVGPTMGDELRNIAIWSTVVVLSLILLYISFRFSFDYAVCTVASLLYVVIIVVGSFAILGRYWGVEIDSLFITALLTVVGFSVHDTIVTFDRLRENAGDMGRGKTFSQVANDSLNQTLVRSINTSVTTVFPLLTLTIFGGITIKYFSLAMLIGILAGTYSSLFIATQLLVDWKEKARANA